MKIIRQFLNIIKEAFNGIFRNKTMSFTSTISIGAMLTLFGIVLLMILNLNTIVHQTGEKLDKVIFYLEDSATDEEVNKLIDEIAGDENVKRVTYVSKDEALEQFKSEFSDDASFLDEIPGDNPIPASLTVDIKELSYGKNIENKYKDNKIIEDHKYLYDFITKMMKVETGVKYVGAVIVSILLLISVLIIHNTIKIAVSNRHREISIMKYVGATNRYIRGPFLIEGILFGVIGAAIATFLTSYLYGFIFEKVNPQLVKMTEVDLVNLGIIKSDLFIIFLCIGISIGYLGSLFSTKRFLDV